MVAVAALVCGGTLAADAGADGTAPAFVQQVSAHASGVSSLKLTLGQSVTATDRLVVEVGVWSSSGATASSVTDAAGNAYSEVLHFKAADTTEMSVWTAPITAGGGTRPAITVKPSAKADVGVAALEYSGLSAASGVVDQISQATGKTSGAATVASGATPPTSAASELALGFYADSGFGTTPTVGTGFTQRSTISRASDMDLLAEDETLSSSGATPNAMAGTGANTQWLMATITLRAGSSAPPTAPSAPTSVTATAGDGTATVNWTAPDDGGSPITGYTVTPYVGSSAQTPTTVGGQTTSTTVSGLTDGTTYTFKVKATNAVGTGPDSAASNAVTPSAASGGQWGPLMTWPMVAIHSILMHNGKVLQFDGWQQPEPTQVWAPATQTFSTQTAPDSVFCSGMAQLPDGRILVIGGYGGLSTGKLGIVDTTIFDPATETWSRVADMRYPRWYPDLTELADGRYVAISGNSTDASTWADTPEVYDPTSNQWTTLTGVSTSQVHEEEYPFSYLVPTGDVFTIGPSEDKSFLLDVDAKSWTPIGGSSGVVNGSSVMYRPGKILYSGGAANLNSSTPAEATTSVIDLNSQTPAWRKTQSMGHARIYHTLTMLADGTVLAVGGEPTAGQTGQSEVSGGVLPSEIWDPTTETWSPAAATGTTRGYHSTALLMPDGTVLVGGSGHANPGLAGQDSSQVYSPPYLFKGARPAITSAPGSATYGANLSVSTPDASSISAVNLVSLGSDTHQSDMDQHFVPLNFTAGSGSLSVQAPSSGAYAPPGYYMLFIVNDKGVPSVASIVQISAQAKAPAAPTNVTAAAGNASATVTWTAPSDQGSPIQSYTVTPYLGSAAQSPTIVSGPNPPTNTTVNGLTNGTAYTFTVSATNTAGTGPESSPSAPVTPSSAPAPAFVQQVSAHAGNVSSLSVKPLAKLGSANRLVVETGIWNSSRATAKSVSDSAGDPFTELVHYQAGDGTETAVWTAPITAGAQSTPAITVTATGKADVGVAALEYSGLSTAADATVVDQMAHAVGKTNGAATVSSGATPPTGAGNELAVGFYADSGFGNTLSPGAGFTPRVSVSNTGDMELLVEDKPVDAGTNPAATFGTGPSTFWSADTVVFKAAQAGSQAMGLRSEIAVAGSQSEIADAGSGSEIASAGSGSEIADAGSPALSGVGPSARLVRRELGAHRRAKRAVARRSARAYRCLTHANRRSSFCRSLRRAAAVARADRHRFYYQALLKRLSPSLLCHHIGQQLSNFVDLSSHWDDAG